MNIRQQEWKRAADELGFKVEIPFVLKLESGKTIEAELLIQNFGDKCGTLIFTDFKKLNLLIDELKSTQFYWSVIGESSPNQEFDIESFIDCLSDWQWCGAEIDRPVWLRDPPEYEPPEC
jgi:hypothetical protein